MRVRVGAVPARDAVVQVGVHHVPELLEGFEVPVHGRGSDTRVLRAHPAGDLLGGDVMACALHRVQHELPLQREPLAARADRVREGH